jgi:hypothetical protein
MKTFNSHIKTFDELVQTAPRFVKRKLEQLKLLRERPDFHPEKSAFEHIKIVTTRLFQTGNPDLIMAGVFHDLGKFSCVKMNEKTGFPTSPGHDVWAANLIINDAECSQWITSFGANPANVATICGEHMRVKGLSEMRPTKQQALQELEMWPHLEIFTMADDMLKDFHIENCTEQLRKIAQRA